MPRRHYSIRTYQIYCSWVKRFVLFHKMKTRDDMQDGEKKIESFLDHRALDLHVAPFTESYFLRKSTISRALESLIPFIAGHK